MKKQLIIIAFALLLVMPLVSGATVQVSPVDSLTVVYPQFESLKQNTSFTIDVHVDNITQILNGAEAECYLYLYNEIDGQLMEGRFTPIDRIYQINISAGNFTKLIGYQYVVHCNTTSQTGFASGRFDVTKSGQPTPSGSVKIFFMLMFLICLGFSIYLILYNIGHVISLDFDIIDVAFNWGVYFVVFALYGFETFYMGNAMMETMMLWFLSIRGLTLIFFPLLALILSLTVGTLMKGRFNTTPPKRLKFRRGN